MNRSVVGSAGGGDTVGRVKEEHYLYESYYNIGIYSHLLYKSSPGMGISPFSVGIRDMRRGATQQNKLG